MAQSAQQLKTAETSRSSLPEDLKHNTVDIPVVMQRQVLVIQKSTEKGGYRPSMFQPTETARSTTKWKHVD